MPGGGGTTQTAVNVSAGARTQLAEMVTAAMTLVTMFFLAPLVAMLPQSALAALVVVYSFNDSSIFLDDLVLMNIDADVKHPTIAYVQDCARRH